MAGGRGASPKPPDKAAYCWAWRNGKRAIGEQLEADGRLEDAERYRCHGRPPKGRTRCRLHGGATPRGPDSPHWRHGEYSGVVPDDLYDRFIDFVRDPEILSLKRDIGMLRLVSERHAAVALEGGGPTAWRQGREIATRLEAMLDGSDFVAAVEAVAELKVLFSAGANATDAERAFLTAVDRKRKLIRDESTRLHREHSALSVPEVLGILRVVTDAVVAELSHDPERLARIAAVVDGLRIGRTIVRTEPKAIEARG